jgi:hypothetical protein
MESFFSSLKTEVYHSRDEARANVSITSNASTTWFALNDRLPLAG